MTVPESELIVFSIGERSMILAAHSIAEFQLLVFVRDDPEKILGSIFVSDFLTMNENLSRPETTSPEFESILALYSASSMPS